MLKIKTSFFNGSIIDDESLSYSSFNTPLHHLVVNVIEELSKNENFINLEFKLDKKYINEEYFEIPKEDIEIEFIIVDNIEVFDYFNAGEAIGLHSITAGVFEEEDNDYLAKKHRVFISINEEYLKEYFLNERLNELDPYSDSYDYSYLAGYLITITHEGLHGKEFIEHANGMTPSEVNNLIESEEFELSLSDVSTGNGSLFPYMDEDDNVSEQDLRDVMEERVESAGRTLFYSLKLDPLKVKAVLNYYLPSDNLIDSHLNKNTEDTEKQLLKSNSL